MSRFFRLFRCHLKRFFLHSSGVFAFSILFFVILAFIASVFVKNMSFSGNRNRLKVGVVGDISIPYFEAGLNTLKYLDSSNKIVEIMPLTLQDAKSLMRKGKLSAYIVIPEGFIEAVEVGDNDKKIVYVTSIGAQGIESLFKEHVADIVSNLLINAQAGIFAMENLAVNHRQYDRLNDYVYEMNLDYIKWTLDRKNFVRIEEVPVSNGVGIYGYYVCAVICAFLIFFSINSLWFFTGNNNDRFRFHFAKGFSAVQQISAEYFSYFILVAACVGSIFILSSIFVFFSHFELAEWRYIGAVRGISELLISSIVVCFMYCALHIFLFEVVSQTVSAILLQFLAGFSLSFIGGCFYPLDFFPEFIQKIGSALPVGKSLVFMDSALAGKIDFSSLIFCFAYTFLFLLLAVILRKINIKKELAI